MSVEQISDGNLKSESDVPNNASFTEQNVALSNVLGKRLSEASILPVTASWKRRSKHSEKIKSVDFDENLKEILQASSCVEIKTMWKRMWKNNTLSQRQIIVSSPFMTKLSEKIIGSDFKWDAKLVRLIVSCDMLSARFCSGLIDAILEHNDLDLLVFYLQHVRDICEKDVVKCLNKLIPLENHSLSSELDEFIRDVMKLPYTETTLVQELRHLHFERALVLMSHLSTVLKTADLMTNSCISQVFTWTSLLLDAHFAETIVSSEAAQIIVDLQETTAIQMELYKELTELDVTVKKIQNAIAATKSKMADQKRFLYKIEVMAI